MPKAQVNGININYQIDGAETGRGTIVLINGLADDLESWGYQIPALVDAGYRVLRFDNRGIGNTDAPAGPYSSRMLADDAKALVDMLGIRDFHLMGAVSYTHLDVYKRQPYTRALLAANPAGVPRGRRLPVIPAEWSVESLRDAEALRARMAAEQIAAEQTETSHG